MRSPGNHGPVTAAPAVPRTTARLPRRPRRTPPTTPRCAPAIPPRTATTTRTTKELRHRKAVGTTDRNSPRNHPPRRTPRPQPVPAESCRPHPARTHPPRTVGNAAGTTPEKSPAPRHATVAPQTPRTVPQRWTAPATLRKWHPHPRSAPANAPVQSAGRHGTSQTANRACARPRPRPRHTARTRTPIQLPTTLRHSATPCPTIRYEPSPQSPVGHRTRASRRTRRHPNSKPLPRRTPAP